MKLFDSGFEDRKAAAARLGRDEVRQRAEAVERVLAEEKSLDAATNKLGAQLAAVTTVQAIRYDSFRPPGSKWLIEHGQAGEDYFFQVFPLRPTKVALKDVIGAMIVAMEVVFPRSVQIYYKPPNDGLQVKFFTIKVEKVVGLPGWEKACKERALHGLVEIQAW